MHNNIGIENSEISVFVIAHKDFEGPADPMYKPLQVGAVLHEDLGFLRDDLGDEISRKNPSYCELTGMYWVWKNIKSTDIVGICHYRRYFVKNNLTIFTSNDIKNLLREYDVITSKMITLNNSYRYGFSVDHHVKDLDLTGQVIKNIYPEYYDDFLELSNGPHTYFGNLLIMKKPLYDNYMEWLFNILFEVEKHVDMSGYTPYQKRLFGFLSEFLQTVYIKHNNLKAYETMIGMSGEKKETYELRTTIEQYFDQGDFIEAKSVFIKAFQKRPDILMEASDINGELKLCMQIISTCEFEAADGQLPIVKKCMDHCLCFDYFNLLNKLVIGCGNHISKSLILKKAEGDIDMPKTSACTTSPLTKELFADFLTDEAINIASQLNNP